MVYDPRVLNPTNAPKREQTPFTNIARCVKNEISTAGEAYKNSKNNRWQESMLADDPVWVLEYETLDAKFSDGNALRIFGTFKLLESIKAFKNRQQREPNTTRRAVDEENRAPIIAKGFAGLNEPIVAFPGAEGYDESRMVGNVFLLASIKQIGKEGEDFGSYPVPTQELGTDFIFTGKVRTIQSKGGAGGSNGATPVTPIVRDIATDESLGAAIREAVGGISPTDTDALAAAIKTVTPLAGLQLAGKGVGGLIVGEEIGNALAEAGLLS